MVFKLEQAANTWLVSQPQGPDIGERQNQGEMLILPMKDAMLSG